MSYYELCNDVATSIENAVFELIGKPEFTFVLDPIDDTFNAVNNIPFFCVPMAIENSNLSDIRYGFVKNLANGDIYSAEKGKGAFLNNRKLVWLREKG